MKKLVILWTIVICSLGCLGTSISIDGVGYQVVGETETVEVSFLEPTGGISVELYSGFVMLSVSGTGTCDVDGSYNTPVSDAFYIFDYNGQPIIPYNPDVNYQLTIATELITPISNPFDHNVKNHIVYDLDAALEVTPVYVPLYQDDHVYNFVVDTGTSELSQLYFGFNDGYFDDNGGLYVVQITQLTPVPEPTSIVLFSLGLFGLMLSRIKRGRR